MVDRYPTRQAFEDASDDKKDSILAGRAHVTIASQQTSVSDLLCGGYMGRMQLPHFPRYAGLVSRAVEHGRASTPLPAVRNIGM